MIFLDSRARTVLEWTLRNAMLVALAVAIWLSVVLRKDQDARAQGGPAAMRAALARWSTVETPRHAHAVFDSVPPPDVRDWFRALAAAGGGTRVSWQGAALKPAAISLEPVPDPNRPVRVWVASAPLGDVGLAIHDSIGLIDSLSAGSGGGVLTVGDINGVVHATAGSTVASSVLRDSIVIKPVLVRGTASWEGKFIVASLEEHGWKIDARFALAPTGDVVQGGRRGGGRGGRSGSGGSAKATSLNIDTSRYSAVIALDTAAATYATRIAEFVRRGGGLIATGAAAALPALAALLPASTAASVPEAPFEADSAHPRRALAMTPLVQVKSDAVVIEKVDDRISVAAHRLGRGRVLQVGYLDTWRWRMAGFGDPVRAYRQWWSAMVSSVAYAPRSTIASQSETDPMPVASLIGALGGASPQSGVQKSLLNDPRLLIALFAVIVAALFLETASRRLRGRA